VRMLVERDPHPVVSGVSHREGGLRRPRAVRGQGAS
jgi:hypothetical protein